MKKSHIVLLIAIIMTVGLTGCFSHKDPAKSSVSSPTKTKIAPAKSSSSSGTKVLTGAGGQNQNAEAVGGASNVYVLANNTPWNLEITVDGKDPVNLKKNKTIPINLKFQPGKRATYLITVSSPNGMAMATVTVPAELAFWTIIPSDFTLSEPAQKVLTPTFSK